MANKEINIVIAAKNAMAQGLSSAKESLAKFGESAQKIAGFFVKGFLAAGTAVAGFAAKALHAYAQQEAAERSVIAAMNAHGEAGEALLPMYRRIADAIQDETGAADENTLASMANMRMLGVRTDQMEQAAKGLIGLKSAGMEGAAAERAMAAALQGNYDMLTRYIPALRGVTDEAEKQRIVNDFLTKGYAQQKEQLNTVAGQWGALKGRVGDVWEEFGRVIAQNGAVLNALKMAQDAVAAFSAKVKEWVEGGGIQNLIAGFQHFGNEVAHIWNMYVRSPFELTMAVIGDAAETAVNYVKGVFTAMVDGIQMDFRQMGEVAAAAWELVKNPGREAFNELRELSALHRDERKQHAEEAAAALMGAETLVTRRTSEALDERRKYQEQYAAKAIEISEKHAASLIAHQEQIKQAAIDAAQAEADMRARTADDIADRARQATRDQLQEIRTRIQAEREAGNDVTEIARKVHEEGREWAKNLTASLHHEIDERVENEEEAAELKRQINEQLKNDIHVIHQGLTQLIKQEQMARVDNEKEAAEQMAQVNKDLASETVNELKRVEGQAKKTNSAIGGSWIGALMGGAAGKWVQNGNNFTFELSDKGGLSNLEPGMQRIYQTLTKIQSSQLALLKMR